MIDNTFGSANSMVSKCSAHDSRMSIADGVLERRVLKNPPWRTSDGVRLNSVARNMIICFSVLCYVTLARSLERTIES